MKDIKKLSDDELLNEINGDVSTLSDEELLAQIEEDSDPLNVLLNSVSSVANLIDYPVSIPRAAAISAIDEYKKPESTAGSVLEAAGMGGTRALARNPLTYDQESSWSELARTVGVPSKKMDLPDMPTSGPLTGMYNVVKNITPSDLVGFGAEFFVDPFTIAGKTMDVAGFTKGTLSERAAQNIEKSLARQSTVSGEDVWEQFNRGRVAQSARTIQKKGLTKYITSPEDMLTAIEGKTEYIPSPIKPGKFVPTKTMPGALDPIGKKIDQGIVEFDRAIKSTGVNGINRQAFSDRVFNNLSGRFSDIESGAIYDPAGKEALALKDKVNKIFKVWDDKETTMRNIINLKRSAQEKIYELSRGNIADVEGASNLLNIYQEVEKTVDDFIDYVIKGDPNFPKAKPDQKIARDFVEANQEYSDLKTVSNLIKGSKYDSLKEILPADMIPGMAITGTAIGATGLNPLIGAGLYGGARTASNAISGSMPSYMARTQDVLSRITGSIPGLETGAKALKGPGLIYRAIEGEENQRVPQSIMAESIVQYEIPRSVQEILAQKDLVMAKIQSEVQDPQVLMMAQQMLDGLQKNPESVKPVLGQLANMMPQIFVKDKYNRFDRIVPMDMRPVAIEDIKQSDVSPAIKAQKINLLHNRGQLLD